MDNNHQLHDGHRTNLIFNWIWIGFLPVAGYAGARSGEFPPSL
jgi:hypothetical protein